MQNPQFPISRSGPAFTSPEQVRPVQFSTLPNPYPSRFLGFTSPPQDRGTSFYYDDPSRVAVPAQPVAYLSERFPIQTRHEIAQVARPATMESESTFAQSQSLYQRRTEANRYESGPALLTRTAPMPSAQIIKTLPPELFLLVTQPKIDLKQGFFEVEGANAPRLKEIFEESFIENSKRVFINFFNDTNKSHQEIVTNFDLLSNSLQQFYTSRRSSNTSTIQAARNFSPSESQAIAIADAKANDYLKLRLTVMIDALSQIDDQEIYNKIKEGISRLIAVNQEITLDQQHNNLLALTYQDRRSSSSLSSSASIQSLPQTRDGKGILRQDSTRRIDELEKQNQETLTKFNAGQNLLSAESQKLQEATQQIDRLNKLKVEDEQKIYELTTLLSSYERNSVRLNLLAQQEMEIETTRLDIEKLESQKQELEAQLDYASQTNQSEKDQLNQRLQEKQSEIENHQRKIIELQYLIASGKEGIELMNSEISEIQKSLSQNLAEFNIDASKYLEATDRIIAEGMLRDVDNGESIQDLKEQLHKITEAYEEFRNFSNELNKTQGDKESTILRLQALLANSQREVRGLSKRLISASELIETKVNELAISEKTRKDLTGEKAVEDWLPPSEQKKEELTPADIENYLKWAPTSGGDQKNSTLQQGTQATDLLTLKLPERIKAISAFIAEVVCDLREKNPSSQQDSLSGLAKEHRPSSQQASSQQASLQQDSLQQDSLQQDSSQRPSSPSGSPRPDQEGQSRLSTDMQVAISLMAD